jgi:hypothetical protein
MFEKLIAAAMSIKIRERPALKLLTVSMLRERHQAVYGFTASGRQSGVMLISRLWD